MQTSRQIRLGALPEGELLAFLDRARHLLWWDRSMLAMARSAWIAMLPALAMLLVSKVVDVPWPAMWPLFAFASIFIMATAAQVWRRPSRYEAARRMDRRLNLHERLTTALELHSSKESVSGLREAQLLDTVGRIRRVDLFKSAPLQLPTRHALTFVVLLGLSGLVLVTPTLRRSSPQPDATVQKSIAQEAQRLAQAAQEVTPLQPDGQLTKEQAAAAAALQQLQQSQQQSNLSSEEALAHLSDAEASLRLQQTGTANDTRQALEKAAAVLATEPATKDIAQSLTGGKPADTASKLNQLAQSTAAMSETDRDRVAATLRAAGAQAAKTDPAVGQALQRAGDSAAMTDSADRSQAFSQAATTLQQTQTSVLSQSQVQRALSQLQASERAISQAAQQNPSRNGQNGQQGEQAAQAEQQGQSSSPSDQQSQGASPSDQQGQNQSSSGNPATAQSQSASDATQGQAASQGDSLSQGQGQSQTASQAASQTQASSGQGQGQGQQPGNGSGQGAGSQNGPGGGQGERIYDPKSVPSHSIQVNGQTAATGRQQTVQGTGPQDPVDSQAMVPYPQLYEAYRQQATDTIDSNYIPLSMKDLVRDYFTSLSPQH